METDPLLRRFFEVFVFEALPASGRRADEVYLQEVNRCDIYVGLFGNEYGHKDTAGLSPTEREFHRASSEGKELLIFIKGHDDTLRHPKMQTLVHRAGALFFGMIVRRRFGTVSELTAGIYASLVEYLDRTGDIRTLPFDAAACPGAVVDDLSHEKMQWFLDRSRRYRNFGLSETTPHADLLTHLNLLDGGVPSHAAVLLFGNNPQRFLTTSEVKCAHFHGIQVRKPHTVLSHL